MGAPILDTPFLSWGYRDVGTDRAEAGLPAFGTVATDAADRGQRVLYLKTEEVDRGMSGAPVVQGEPPRVVGILTTALPREGGSFALPVDRIAEQFPTLGAIDLLPALPPVPMPARLRWLARARRPSALFVGRQEDLLGLDDDLHAAGGSGLPVAVEGLSGVGKTELALQYLRHFGDPLRYPGGVVWLDADADLGAQWAALAGELGLDPGAAEPAALEGRVLERLAAHPGLLLILDNARSWKSLKEHLPSPEAGHSLLVTTKVRDLGGPQLRHRPLELLSPEGARSLLVALLGERAKRHPEEVETLVAALGGHTLALEVAGAYLSRRPQVAAADFLARSGEPVPEGLLDAVAYQKDFSRMMAAVIAGLADQRTADLFALTGLYGQAPAPVALLRSTWEDLGGQGFDEAFGELYDLHLVEHDEGWWTMHLLISAAAREHLAGAELERALEVYSKRLADTVKALAEYDFAGFVALESHVRHEIDQGARTWGSCQVIGESAIHLRRLGKLAEAKDWAQRAVDLAASLPNMDEEELAIRRSNLALILQDLGDFPGARREVEEALRIDLASLGPDHPKVAIYRSNLAMILKDLGDLPGARREVEEALRIDLASLGPNHRSVAIRRSNLALILQDLGELQGARREVEEALRIDLTSRGPDYPTVGICRSNLAMILQALGDLRGAHREIEEALRIDLTRLGPDHPNVAILRSNLATILKDLGDLPGARREVEEALRVDLASLGPDHPYVAVDRSQLANYLEALGDLATSRREASEAVRIAKAQPAGAQVREDILRRWPEAESDPAG